MVSLTNYLLTSLGIGVFGFISGYIVCRGLIKDICMNEVGLAATKRIFGDKP